ncbi:MAG: hypothetical protein IKX34_08400 [Bacteroidales bacterium]|nr:hypothetical protein [Bacteroidales bacterium]
MKKSLLILAAWLLFAGWISAQDRVVERTYLSTDKDVYVAGEPLWYSAFCVDAARGTFSPVSSIAYVELHNPEGLVCTGKVALSGGRGAGRLQLPGTLPTGNYRLVAYTTQNRAEADYDYTGIASKTISVFNVFSNERVKDGVDVVSEEEYARLVTESVMPGSDRASIDLRWSDGVLTLVNPTGETASLSVSIWHDDGFLTNGNPTIDAFVDGCRQVGPRRLDDGVTPEYEGEIIWGHVAGVAPEAIASLAGRYAFISTPSDKSDIYTSPIDVTGRVCFFTGNIYGNKECVCEIEGMDPAFGGFIELESPFVGAKVADTEPLKLSASLREPLRQRSLAMQIEQKFTADTLLDLLPVKENGLFGNEEVVYPLDDYTRFPTMGEVFIEFVKEIRARRWNDRRRNLQVRLNDRTDISFSHDTTLMLLDGVPVFDQQKIMDYDPLLVESIHIYPYTSFIGSRTFEGIVNFVTYKHTLPGFTFGNNVRVIDFQGVSWPLAFTGAPLLAETDYPDYRQTIYWHPVVKLTPGQVLEIPCKLPDYKGCFRVVVEGLTAGGKPLRATTSFTTD